MTISLTDPFWVSTKIALLTELGAVTGRGSKRPNCRLPRKLSGLRAATAGVLFDPCGVVRSWDVRPWVGTHGYSYSSPLGTHGGGSWGRSLGCLRTAQLQIAPKSYVFRGMVGMARCAVRAARLRRNVWRNSHVARDPFPPRIPGLAHRTPIPHNRYPH